MELEVRMDMVIEVLLEVLDTPWPRLPSGCVWGYLASVIPDEKLGYPEGPFGG